MMVERVIKLRHSLAFHARKGAELFPDDVPTGKRICKGKCGLALPTGKFYTWKDQRDNRTYTRTECKDCHLDKTNEARRNRKGKGVPTGTE